MTRLGLFEGIGIEIEYMIVDAESLDVRPICDQLMEAVAGEPVSEVERGSIAWSNELALHVLELKTNGPAAGLDGLAGLFAAEVRAANGFLGRVGGRLLPGGAHPWMDPARETRLWPHEHDEVYRTFDRIFGCAGHGWSNLQSTHVNLPFADDGEFGRLHAAIRATLPLIPALAASSPFLDGVCQPFLDARLEAYRLNAVEVPEVAGSVVPEPIRTEEEYRERILAPLYEALAPHDPDCVLRHEWTNARGAIARFERGAIEVRVIDAQEAASADLAVVALIVAVVRALTEERWGSSKALDALPTEELSALFRSCVQAGGDAVVASGGLLSALGMSRSEASAERVWRDLADRTAPDGVPTELGSVLERIVAEGTLSVRMVRAMRGGATVREITGRLAECLAENELFRV